MPGIAQIPLFHGQPRALVDKLNQLVESLNTLMQINGDGQFINVSRSPLGGLAISLDMDHLVQFIPRREPGFFPVVVALDGGSAGTATTQCTFTYTLKDFLGNILRKGSGALATQMPQKRPRPAKGKMVAQPVALTSYGVAFVDRNGLQLWDAGEVPAVKTC